MRGALNIERTGIFGGDHIEVTAAGEAWRVNSSRVPTLVADVNVRLEGVITTPSDPVTCGPIVGRFIAGHESTCRMYVVAPDGSSFFVSPNTCTMKRSTRH